MDLESTLNAHGQSHLVSRLRELPDPDAARLRAELASISWDEVNVAHSAGCQPPSAADFAGTPARAEVPNAPEREICRRQGLELLKNGRAAFVLMAGGQGSRLGFAGPKGAAPLGWPHDWKLFDLLVRRLKRLGQLAGRNVPCLVMTSPANDAATRSWFACHDVLPSGSVRFFQQGVFPALDDAGRALLTSGNQLALAPDGNGGIFNALERSGLLRELAAEGVTWLHIAGVDNALSIPCDPVFLGFADRSGAAVASKSVLRGNPAEKAGVFREGSSGTGVAEYTELGALAGKRDADGGLLYREANIASHLVKLDAARRFAGEGMPWHLARKRLAHIDPETGLPSEKEVCKFEHFLFDAFPRAGRMAILRVERRDEFAPVKNAEGADSPASALAALLDQGKRWRESWGISGVNGVVDPLLSLQGERPEL